jgi:hypothetical protein
MIHDKALMLGNHARQGKAATETVYLAAPDIAFNSFAGYFIKFKDIVDRTTINLNQSDRVLKLSAFKNGISRLGKPDPKDITPEQQQIMIAASKTSKLDILNVSSLDGLQVGAAHGSWYTNPWVSNDMLFVTGFNISPMDRGLERSTMENGLKLYYFPKDYDLRVREIIDSYKEELFEELEKVKEVRK